MAVITKRSFML